MIYLSNIAFLTILGLIAIEDLKTMEISNRWHLLILMLGVFMLLLGNGTLSSSICGAFAVSLPMLGLAVLCPGSIGGGDIKMVGASGFLIGAEKIIVGSGLGFLLGGIVGAVLLMTGKKKATDHFPFGPWLAIGIAAAALDII